MIKEKLTHVMNGPLVRVLSCGLVFEEREKQIFGEIGVGVQEGRVSREDNIDGIL